MNEAARRVWGRLPAGTRDALAGLSPTDLQTALMDLAAERAGRVRPADLVRRWKDDRFVRPAQADPRVLNAVEGRLWEMLPDEVGRVELSPVAPLGVSSGVGPVSQNRILSTVRTSEVVSDPTNVLALEAASRRRGHDLPVHLATCHRVIRAQDFGPGWSAHFRLFALVSSARDTGSSRTEIALLRFHLDYWARVLTGRAYGLEFSVFDDPVLGERLRTAGLAAVPDATRQRGRGYYAGAALRITVDGGEVGDGGFTTWTAQLLGDAKERCLISCLAPERLLADGG